VAHAIAAGVPAFRLDPVRLASGTQDAAAVAAWLERQPPERTALVYATAEPDAVRQAQAALGTTRAGTVVEQAMAEIAVAAVAQGRPGSSSPAARPQARSCRRSACARSPSGRRSIGAPWTRVVDGPAIALALKSGNFGKDDFFTRAWSLIA
jgi:uncharacterized protein YgbK (DUF1537 family)